MARHATMKMSRSSTGRVTSKDRNGPLGGLGRRLRQFSRACEWTCGVDAGPKPPETRLQLKALYEPNDEALRAAAIDTLRNATRQTAAEAAITDLGYAH